ncbi:leucine-rich repeat protein [Butyrivibrio sp. MB2005]|uniref:leucine-rich repeat protein n=1 Tax=Butyrivibrio sp. MB2005 TaxID=1280678 RepID=UPI000415958F|nr:leucine-rich repeat protein [Butyrivibrio sp. MB2005]
MKKTLFPFFIFLLFFFAPITANAKTYYIMDNRDGRPLVDENDNSIEHEKLYDLTAGDIIYLAPNKYEVINVEFAQDNYSSGYRVNCKCLVNKSKDGKFAYIIDETKFNGFRDYLTVKEFDKNAFNSYKNLKQLYISLEVIPSWINKKVKNLSELKLGSDSLVKKNTFANCKKLKSVSLNNTCSLEKNSFKNVKTTVWYDNGVHDYDKVKGDTYTTAKSVSQIKKEMKKAGFKKGTVVHVQKYNKNLYSKKVYKTIKI